MPLNNLTVSRRPKTTTVPRIRPGLSNKIVVRKNNGAVKPNVLVKVEPAPEPEPEHVVEPVVASKLVQEDASSKAVAVAVAVARGEDTEKPKPKPKPKSKVVVKRKRTRNRDFGELHADVTQNLKTASEALKLAARAVRSMMTSHSRAVTRSKHRNRVARTPSTLFDQELVDFFRSMLDASELVVTRNQGHETLDISNLSVETRLHRTDATQLYNKVFKKHGLTNPDNGRLIMYQNSPELVNLLLSGDHKPEMQNTLQQLRDGTYELSIFNIQKFTTPHLHKAPNDTTPIENIAE